MSFLNIPSFSISRYGFIFLYHVHQYFAKTYRPFKAQFSDLLSFAIDLHNRKLPRVCGKRMQIVRTPA